MIVSTMNEETTPSNRRAMNLVAENYNLILRLVIEENGSINLQGKKKGPFGGMFSTWTQVVTIHSYSDGHLPLTYDSLVSYCEQAELIKRQV